VPLPIQGEDPRFVELRMGMVDRMYVDDVDWVTVGFVGHSG
jgi:hypothetical protein